MRLGFTTHTETAGQLQARQELAAALAGLAHGEEPANRVALLDAASQERMLQELLAAQATYQPQLTQVENALRSAWANGNMARFRQLVRTARARGLEGLLPDRQVPRPDGGCARTLREREASGAGRGRRCL